MNTNLPPRSLPPEGEPGSLSPEEKKEQYNLDEIMKALRDKEREKDERGEVVTRADGTIARKVKRRRRRSDQPEKVDAPQKEKKRLLFKVVVAATLMLLLCLAGLFLILLQNSKGHRETLEQRASGWTGAKVEFKGLKRMPFSCSMQGATFEWDQNSMIKSLKLQKISGDVEFRNYLGLRPSGVQIGGMTGTMVLGLPFGKSESGQSLDEADFPFDFDQYFCESLDVTFGGTSPIGITGAGASLGSIGEEGYQLILDQGSFRLNGWNDFPIANGLMRFKEGVLNVKSLSLEHPTNEGTSLATDLQLSGKIPLKRGEKAILEIKSEEFPLEVLLGKRLALFFSGTTIASTGKVFFTVGNDYLDEIKIDFTATTAKMAKLPFLANLDMLFPEHNLDSLEFSEGITKAPIMGTLRVRPEGVAMEGLEMALHGKVKLRGSMVIGKSGVIGGGFDLWINRFYLTSQPRFKKSPLIVQSEASGFVKVNFKVKGTIAEPDDTFLEAIGVDSGSVRPAGDGSGEIDVWDSLQKLEEEPSLLPDGFGPIEEGP
ncbi:MAG: hypothetical protein ACJAVK_000342 [Akkermansiaceae bacterium]|jgi:hypothetical protein